MEIIDITDPESILTFQILETLTLVKDPELEINIVDMGLIYNVDVRGKEIRIQMTLSSKGCPMGGSIVDSVQNCLDSHYPAYHTCVDLVWEPVWSMDQISAEGKEFLGM